MEELKKIGEALPETLRNHLTSIVEGLYSYDVNFKLNEYKFTEFQPSLRKLPNNLQELSKIG